MIRWQDLKKMQWWREREQMAVGWCLLVYCCVWERKKMGGGATQQAGRDKRLMFKMVANRTTSMNTDHELTTLWPVCRTTLNWLFSTWVTMPLVIPQPHASHTWLVCLSVRHSWEITVSTLWFCPKKRQLHRPKRFSSYNCYILFATCMHFFLVTAILTCRYRS